VFTILAAAFLAASLRAPTLTFRFGRNLVLAGVLAVTAGDLAMLLVLSGGPVKVNLGFLAPGLVLVGLGQGLWITPLTTTVLSYSEPQRAGMVSGALSTMQQIGSALGVAAVGVVFFGNLTSGYTPAFSSSLVELVIALALAAALTRILPSRPSMAPLSRR
jgi:MFS family permease